MRLKYIHKVLLLNSITLGRTTSINFFKWLTTRCFFLLYPLVVLEFFFKSVILTLVHRYSNTRKLHQTFAISNSYHRASSDKVCNNNSNNNILFVSKTYLMLIHYNSNCILLVLNKIFKYIWTFIPNFCFGFRVFCHTHMIPC